MLRLHTIPLSTQVMPQVNLNFSMVHVTSSGNWPMANTFVAPETNTLHSFPWLGPFSVLEQVASSAADAYRISNLDPPSSTSRHLHFQHLCSKTTDRCLEEHLRKKKTTSLSARLKVSVCDAERQTHSKPTSRSLLSHQHAYRNGWWPRGRRSVSWTSFCVIQIDKWIWAGN